ncbi:MAG: Yip1 family protein [Terracidiphilus sp.]
MSDMNIQPAAGEAPGLSQWQRVTNTFSAPSKTFEDIQRGNRSWWMPFLISILASYVLFGAITLQIGWAQVVENTIHLNPKMAERMEQVPAAQREMSMKFTQYSMEGGFAASPIIILIAVALGSLILLGTINFIFGGKATFGSILAVWMYAGLPGIIKALLGAVVIFAGIAPESFNLNNFAPTSVGAFLNPLETNAALYKLASALDVTTIWTMVLLGIGIAAVAKVKRNSGYIAVFGWWALITLIGVGWAAASS